MLILAKYLDEQIEWRLTQAVTLSAIENDNEIKIKILQSFDPKLLLQHSIASSHSSSIPTVSLSFW
jgi:hypothetical protein